MTTAIEPRVQQSISLLPRHRMAVKRLAFEDGDTNLSATIRKLIEREMRSRYGIEWADVLAQMEEGDAS